MPSSVVTSGPEYRIEKHTEPFKWWSPWPDPPPGWWLKYKGRVQVHPSWEAAVAGMYRHIEKRKSMEHIRKFRAVNKQRT